MGLGTTDVAGKVHQGVLGEILSKLFKGKNVISNARKATTIKSPHSSYFLELDVWISELDLCFEFQDDYHYTTTWYNQKSLDLIIQHDDEKRYSVLQKSVTFIVIPCWWDGQEKSLIATIQFHRPDLLVDATYEMLPIPLAPPYKFFDNKYIPDVGKLMLSSFPPLDFGSAMSNANFWWLGEKYDGIRVCWHPVRKNLYTRSGNRITVPKSFRASVPSLFLDTEIWFGRGNFVEAQDLLSAIDDVTEWSSFRLISFDDCFAESETIEFEERFKSMLCVITLNHPFVIPVFRIKCSSKYILFNMLKHIMNAGGEGVILREPRSIYYRRRSTSLVKLKASSGDKEGLVVQTKSDGSIVLQQPDGIIFQVPRDSISLKISPNRGEIVSFSYESFARQLIPVNPQVYRVRKDISWEDLVRDYEKDISLNEASKQAVGHRSEPTGHRVAEKGNNFRVFLENFAKSHDTDPLKPDSWYTLSPKFMKLKKAKLLLLPYKGSFVKALTKLFPEVTFDPAKFPFVPRNYWRNIGNKRKFFIQFAERKGFNPLVPENWYKTSASEFTQYKGGRTILETQSYPAAVAQAFPEIGIVPARFADYPHRYFLFSKNRKKFFVDFAKARGFDPLVPDYWYTVSESQLIKNEGEYALQHYGGNYVKALFALFPDIGLVERKFTEAPKKYISVPEAAKRFFENFAKAQKFDSLVAENWYSVPIQLITTHQGASEIIHHYGKSVKKALISVYPNIGLDEKRFTIVPRQHWSDPRNRRQFFEQYAVSLGFDPLSAENWYSITTPMLYATKGVSILPYYNQSFQKALKEMFPEVPFDATKFVNLL